MIGRFAARTFAGLRRKPHAPLMLLQWHITERCNLGCAHCYQQPEKSSEMGFSELLDVLRQFKELLQWMRAETGVARHGQVTVTGGEPFLRSDFFELLEMLHAEKPRISFAVLSNGSLIDEGAARHLRRLHPRFVQVSVEGTPDTHDEIRGRGNHKQTVGAVKTLVRHGIPTLVSFTGHKRNYNEFADVARLACKLRVKRVWADRMIPAGSGASLEVLSPAETHEFVQLIAKARAEARRRWFVRTEVAMHRALQFLEGGHPYRCAAGDSLFTVQPNGDLYPCRRMPLSVGNLRKTSLIELYRESPVFQQLRDPKQMSSECGACEHSSKCRGGLRCLSLAVNGTPFAADPGCWLASRFEEPKGAARD